MAELNNPGKIQQIIKEHHFSVRKKYGQNFLIDANILEGIVAAAGVTKEDTVLEIGPGMGSLTQYLLEAAGHVTAVEIDPMLIPILEENLKDYDNLTLLQGDILKTDLSHIMDSEKKIKVVANLPYYITTPIIMALLEKQENIESITVMVQKEVAQRMQEGPGSKAYGALSLAVQYYSRPEIVLHVSKNCFLPKPDVDSAVVRLSVYPPEERPVQVQDPDLLFRLIRAAFNQRRKTLLNALANDPAVRMPKEKTEKALEKIGKPASVRGEALSLSDFAALTEALAT